MSNTDHNATPDYAIEHYRHIHPRDALSELAQMLDYLVEARTDEPRAYGETLLFKMIRDNLEMLAGRVTAKPA